jgi:hypothetical protein
MFPIHEKGLVSEQSHYQSTRTVQAIAREMFASSLRCWVPSSVLDPSPLFPERWRFPGTNPETNRYLSRFVPLS